MSHPTLVTARFSAEGIARLAAVCDPVETAGFGVDGVVMPSTELFGRLADVEVLIVEFERVDAAVLDAAPRLRVLGCCRNEPGASIDLEAATARGIPVLFTPGRNAISVAEYTIGLMISAARHIPEAHHLLRHTEQLTAAVYADSDSRMDATAQWSLDPGAPFDRFQGPELFGRTVGIVGLGLIGREIASRARAFGMRLVAYDPYAPDAVCAEAGAERRELLGLAAESDFVVVAAKVTSQSRGLIDREFFAAMKRSAYFVNTARAALVDYDALEASLASGSIAGAALDVYPAEPLPADSGFRSLDNVILSPHLAGASTEVVAHHSRSMADDVERVLRGECPHALANPEVVAPGATR